MKPDLLIGLPVSEKIDQLVLKQIENYKRESLENGIKFKGKKKLYVIYSKNVVAYSYLYILLKKSIYLKLDIIFILVKVDKKYSQEKLINLIKKVNKKKGDNTSILILSPLSFHINKFYVSKFINEKKDIDASNNNTIFQVLNIKKSLLKFFGLDTHFTNKNEKNVNLVSIYTYIPPYKKRDHIYDTYTNDISNKEQIIDVRNIENQCVSTQYFISMVHIQNFIYLIQLFFSLFQLLLFRYYLFIIINIKYPLIYYIKNVLANNCEEIYKKGKVEEDNANIKKVIVKSTNYYRDNSSNWCIKRFLKNVPQNMDTEIYNYLNEFTKYNIPCCVHSIILFIKYYNIKIENKKILILNNNINIFLTLFYFFYKIGISTTVYDAVNGYTICRYNKEAKKKNKQIYFFMKIDKKKKKKLYVHDENDFKNKIRKFINNYIYNINKHIQSNKKYSIIKNNLKKNIIKNSDIIIIGIGYFNILKKNHIKKNAIILDLGINLISTSRVKKKKKKLCTSKVENKTQGTNESTNPIESSCLCERKCFSIKYRKKRVYEQRKVQKKRKRRNINRRTLQKTDVCNDSSEKNECRKEELKNRYNKILLKNDKLKLEFANKLSKFFKNYEIFGDVNLNCRKKSSYISAVPGGIGPITTSMLFYNLYFKKNP
ncbi:bifunctional methylenetetrahydrofolate dehydrogenase/cyclohydrolase, putative [Plasmodium chabaudi chabaudi]|uniref:Bifunctional methylenetetrahydrofolate dehydrogenase/cyclohydrolase, putative n=1 Tax=Plasmodium chabaudi chabaudi TaxID=31271 RepID=A0A4V0K980_PLACU|nr:bifunctional methylenetetrahydrofolate dehydrogenase/cyclohydrolase, putative [Plasmodium chabaudi chabaudi]VTZ69285.1 bifunctional methylenetetrahydrofolate dehydrogenase/cyclohydrolase, putative [Plasmodium chabaudi chabaudi]|eukprot:XP_016654026.1 bifunctional methylenetetrahydrofolate dehydrogenase/cyclohydrolase, putative [Plasmodium chabaudi chabaudi]